MTETGCLHRAAAGRLPRSGGGCMSGQIVMLGIVLVILWAVCEGLSKEE